jgi:DNA-binding MurR/RpiR family transcriptional regulator
LPKFIQNKARVHFNLYRSEYETIKQLAKQNHVSTSEIVRMLIRQLLENQEETKNQLTKNLEAEKQEQKLQNPSLSNLTL